jgi:hypothetical protein
VAKADLPELHRWQFFTARLAAVTLELLDLKDDQLAMTFLSCHAKVRATAASHWR